MMKFKKVLRYILISLFVLLALMGLPIMLPKKMEMDVDNEVKTEVVEGSEQKD